MVMTFTLTQTVLVSVPISVLAFEILGGFSPGFGQIIPDSTLNTQVRSPNGQVFTIEGGTRPENGANLFHSFQDFSIEPNQRVIFPALPGLTNILTRVTGDNLSNLNGTLQVRGAVNFFLLNPNGIVFGNNARLDLGGSFFGSTATSLLFADGVEFFVQDDRSSPLLTISQPIGLNFGVNNPAAIAFNQASLTVPIEQKLIFVGGALSLTGTTLSVPDGVLGLASLGGAGTVQLSEQGLQLADDTLRGNITISDRSQLSVLGKRGGSIELYGHDLTIGNSNLVAGIAPNQGDPTQAAGNILLNLAGDGVFNAATSILNNVGTNAQGAGGDITLTARNLSLVNTLLSTTTEGRQKGGNLRVEAIETFTLFGDSSLPKPSADIVSSLQTIGATAGSGQITLKAKDLTIEGSSILTEIRGTNPQSNLLPGGDIDIDADRIQILGTSLVSAAIFSGAGNGGNISVQSKDIVLDSQGLLIDGVGGGILSNLSQGTTGSAGNVFINSDRLAIRNGSIIAADVLGTGTGGNVQIQAGDSVEISSGSAGNNSFISTAIRPRGQGLGGDIDITTNTLLLNEGGEITASTNGDGDGGNIQIEVTGTTTLQNLSLLGLPSTINTTSGQLATGRGGDISLKTGQLLVQDGGQISAATFSDREGGSVVVLADQISLSGTTPLSLALSSFLTNAQGDRYPSGLFASSPGTGGVAQGRDAIRIETQDLSVSEGAQISVSSLIEGAAGDLTILGNRLFLGNGVISADTVEGDDANIRITIADQIELSDGSVISTNASGTATGGNITIDPIFFILEGGSILSAQNLGGSGNGGNLSLTADFVIAKPGLTNQIVANAVKGNGGNIQITTQSLLGGSFVNISASSEFGLDGTVAIDSPDVNPTQGLFNLPTNVLDPDSQLVSSCAADDRGEFVITGRGGLPPEPTSLPTPTILLTDLDPNSARQSLPFATGELGRDKASAEVITPSDSPLARGRTRLADQSPASGQSLSEQAEQAILLFDRGQFNQAVEAWQPVREEYHREGNTQGELMVSLNQAQALQSLGLQTKALQQLRTIVSAFQDQPTSLPQTIALLQLGNTLRSVGELEESRQVLEQALTEARSLQGSDFTNPNAANALTAALISLGHTARAQKQPDQALIYYGEAVSGVDSGGNSSRALLQFQAQLSDLDLRLAQDSLPPDWQPTAIIAQAQALPPSHASAYSQIHLSQLLLQQSEKTGVNLTTAVLQLLQLSGEQAQQLQDPLLLAYSLGYQGQVYEQQGAWDQAQPLTEQAIEVAQRIQSPEATYLWLWQLGRILQQQQRTADAIVVYEEAIVALKEIRNDLAVSSADVQFTFRDRVEPIYRQLVSLLLPSQIDDRVASASFVSSVSQGNLAKARSLIEDLQLAEVNDYFQDNCTQSTPIAADEVDPKAAVIYPIILDDRLEVIVSIAGRPLEHRSVAVTAKQIQVKTYLLLRSLTTPLRSSQVQTIQGLQEVYRWLIAPIQDKLQEAQIETLVFVADGSLRTLPLSALHNGDRYLIEDYNVVLSPGLQLLDPRPLPRHNVSLLAGGLSKSREGFAPLPFVENEVINIAALIPNHRIYLNESLTQNQLAQDLAQIPTEIIHLATHGEFGTNANETFILTWDGQLNIDELSTLLKRQNNDRVPVELLVLSACKTASGDSRSVLGIAGMAIRSDTRSVIAGLWSLDDRATSLFMTSLYQFFSDTTTTKSQAFRQAQLKLLRDPQFQAPYYWSPYVLVGNWL